jgi:hypothetical protein
MANLNNTYINNPYYRYRREQTPPFSFVDFAIRCFKLFVGICFMLFGVVSALIFVVEGAIAASLVILSVPLIGIRLVMKKRIFPEVKNSQLADYK